jgi:uncharacterized membrane protein YfcA
VLVYLFKVEPIMATAYSLFIVGTSSLVGAFPKYKQGTINLKTALVFGAPSIVAVFATRKLIVPAIPDDVFSIVDFMVTKSILMMLLFAVLMVAASVSMIRDKKSKTEEKEEEQKFNYPMIILEGAVVGVLTGLVGAGGGFLIIPALLFFGELKMKDAIGTSLFIIALNTTTGFIGDVISGIKINYTLLLSLTIIAIFGILIGTFMLKKINNEKLKPAFGWFVLIVGFFILFNEVTHI